MHTLVACQIWTSVLSICNIFQTLLAAEIVNILVFLMAAAYRLTVPILLGRMLIERVGNVALLHCSNLHSLVHALDINELLSDMQPQHHQMI
jgi:hypothetical protein